MIIKNYFLSKSKGIILFVFSFYISFFELNAQCPLTFYAGIGVANSGTAFVTWSNFGPGQYFAFPVLNGGSYDISTCGAAINTQLTGWDPSATSVVFLNTGNGPLCSGNQASATYVPNFTNYMYIQVTETYCGPGGSSSINLYLRQNNNINFTNISSALCPGQTLTLTATPANVGSAPGGYGDPGTFSGANVSGNVFTAPNVTTATVYTVSYTFGYVSKDFTISVNPPSTLSVSASSPSVCQGSSVALTASGADTYTWSGGILNGAPFTPGTTESYTVSATSSVGCSTTSSAVVTVSVNPLPVVSVNSGSICSGKSFTILPTGANTYTISGGSATVSPLTNTSYSVTGTSTAGCVSSNTEVSSVMVNTTPVISVNSGSICSGKSFTILPTGANTYTISGGSATVSPLTNTSYSVTGTSTAGCVSSNTEVSSVMVNTTPVISVNSGSICSGKSFTILPTGANTYTISGGSATVSPLTNTSYSVTGTSTAGCVSSNTAVSSVTVNTTPVISVNSGSICSGNSFTILPTGANTYTISGGSATVSPLTNTSYSVTGTSTAGCVSSNTAVSSVTVNATPTLIANSATICSGATATLQANGADTYTWSNNTVSNTTTVSPTSTTIYTLNGISNQGCAGSPISVTVVVGPAPSISVNSSTICTGASATLIANGVTSYTWSTGANTNSIVVSPTTNTLYSVIGDLLGCALTASNNASVNVLALPIISVNSGVICAGESFTIVPTGAVTYTISGGSNIVSPLTTSNYSVTGTDNNGCESSTSAIATVTVNQLPTISVNSGTICVGAGFVIIPSGASTYTISGGTASVNPITTTSYSVSGTSAEGCVSSSVAISTVVVNANPTLNLISTNILVCAGETATLIATGASTYTWDTSENGNEIAVTPSLTTTYTVTGTNINGCSSSVTIAQGVDACTNIKENNFYDATFNVYPNPNNGLFIVELSVSGNIVVYNMLGAAVYESSANSTQHSINLKEYANGVYYVKLKVNDSTKSIKVIKN